MSSRTATISLCGGLGGEKGLPGENGSTATGPSISFLPGMWETVYDIGKKEENGKSFQGRLIKKKGIINY